MPDRKWMLNRGGKWSGPYEEAQLREYQQRGLLEANVMIKDDNGRVALLYEAISTSDTQQSNSPSSEPSTKTAAEALNSIHAPIELYAGGRTISGIYFFIGMMGIIGSSIIGLVAMAAQNVEAGVAAAVLVGSSIGCFACSLFFNIIIDMAICSQRQAITLDRMNEALNRLQR